MNNQPQAAPSTAGRLLHNARLYDLFGRIMSLGRDRAMRQKLVELAAPKPGDSVLDVGCGTGTLALMLNSQLGQANVHGIDASPEMISVAKKKAAKAQADVDFRISLIEAIPFPDASFEVVTSSLMLHHLSDELKRAGLAEIRRVLKPGGRFAAMDFATGGDSPLGPHRPLGHLMEVFGHSRGESSLDKLLPMLEEAGFSEAEVVPTSYKSFFFVRTC